MSSQILSLYMYILDTSCNTCIDVVYLYRVYRYILDYIEFITVKNYGQECWPSFPKLPGETAQICCIRVPTDHLQKEADPTLCFSGLIEIPSPRHFGPLNMGRGTEGTVWFCVRPQLSFEERKKREASKGESYSPFPSQIFRCSAPTFSV